MHLTKAADCDILCLSDNTATETQTQFTVSFAMTEREIIMTLRTNRGAAKFILLSMITFGIYGLICMMNVGNDLNTIATKHDGKKTMNYLLVALLLTPITLGIAMFVWMHRLSARMICSSFVTSGTMRMEAKRMPGFTG